MTTSRSGSGGSSGPRASVVGDDVGHPRRVEDTLAAVDLGVESGEGAGGQR